jgi:hypothetical protein
MKIGKIGAISFKTNDLEEDVATQSLDPQRPLKGEELKNFPQEDSDDEIFSVKSFSITSQSNPYAEMKVSI